MGWSHQANLDMESIRTATGASDAEMSDLLGKMSKAARAQPDGRQFIAFGRYRDHGVAFNVRNGEITSAVYGDRV